MPVPENLDRICAEYGQAIVDAAGQPDVTDRLTTKALGVLQENGVYALFLFLA